MASQFALPPQQQPKTPLPRLDLGFTLVEVVIGLTIMSLMVLVSVSLYQTSADKVREDAARDKLQTIGNGIQRWQLENNRTYPYSALDPILSKYIDNLEVDAWGVPFKVIPDKGIVYSFGPNGKDDATVGDDIAFRYGVVLTSPPQPPSRLVCRPRGTSVDLTWILPIKDVSGAPLTTGVGTWATEIFRSEVAGVTSTTSVRVKELSFPTRAWTDDNKGSGLLPKTSYYYQARVSRNVSGKTTAYSGFSNVCGAFVVGPNLPQVKRFDASSRIVPVNSRLSFDVDVVDPTSNLSQVDLTFNGQTFPLLSGSANSFHVLRTFTPSNLPTQPCKVPKATLVVKGGTPETVITSKCPALGTDGFEFINTAPVITSFRPGLVNFTVSPGTTATVNFTVEARDNDHNLQEIRAVDATGHSTSFAEANVQFAVERFSWAYDLSTTQTFFVEATARDSEGRESEIAKSQISISRDLTPPETPVVDINASNLCIAEDRAVYTWTIRDANATCDPKNPLLSDPRSRRVTIHWESFDSETPPVSFMAVVSTKPPATDTTGYADFVNNALTQNRTTRAKGWTKPVTSPNYVIEYKDSGDGDLAVPLSEGVNYYLGVRAVNKGNLVNPTIVEPKNPKTGYPQSPFVADNTPPKITQISIENPGKGFVCGGTLVGRWRAEDFTCDGAKDGSGANCYRYRVFEKLATEITSHPSPSMWGRCIYDQVSQTTELRFPLPTEARGTPNKYHRAEYRLAVTVRDNACNWSKPPTSVTTVTEDQTPPDFSGTSPRIVAPGGTLNDPNTIEGVWSGVFYDPEEQAKGVPDFGVKSYEWGITTTCCNYQLPFPNIFPGDGSWRQAGTSISDRAIRQDMLSNGDLVFLAVRAYNWAGCASSIVTYSAAVLVDTSLQLSLKASPTSGFVCPNNLPVQFVAEVRGGGPYFAFPYLQPRSNPIDPDNYGSTSKSAVRTYTYSPLTYYTVKDVGDQTAQVRVESYTSLSATAPNLVRQTTARVICRCQPYLLVLNQGNPAGVGASATVLDLAQLVQGSPNSTFTTDVPLPLSGTERLETPTSLVADPTRFARDASKVGAQYALIAANSVNPPTARIYRWDLATDVTLMENQTLAEQASFAFQKIDISRDGAMAIVTANSLTGNTRRYIQLTLDNGRVTGVQDLGAELSGVLGGIKISTDSEFAISINTMNSQAEKISNPEGSAAVSVLPYVNKSMTPLLIDLSIDNSLAAVTNANATDRNVAFIDVDTQTVSYYPAIESPPSGLSLQTFGVRCHPTDAGQVIFTLGDRVVQFSTTDNLTFTAISGAAVAADPGLKGIDIAYDGSYAVAAASKLNKVLFLQTITPGQTNPFIGSGVMNPFGTRIATLDQNAGQTPIDVNLVDRLAFGQPIVRLVESATFKRGDPLTIRGSNLTPVSGCLATGGTCMLVVKIGGVQAKIIDGDGLTKLTVLVDLSTPTGDLDLIVTNTSIANSLLCDSLPFPVTISP